MARATGSTGFPSTDLGRWSENSAVQMAELTVRGLLDIHVEMSCSWISEAGALERVLYRRYKFGSGHLGEGL